MEVLAIKPPNYDRLVKEFGADWDNGLIVTYGDKVYTKKGGMPLDLVQHELVHTRQQKKMGPMEWWERYYVDTAFRLDQEKEAYAAQIRYIRHHTSNKKKAKKKYDDVIRQMAEMYGEMIDTVDAAIFVNSIIREENEDY